MKNKLFSIFTALAMVLGILVAPFTSAKAADDGTTPNNISTKPDAVTSTVTLHKLMMKEEELTKWAQLTEEKYDGTQDTKALLKNLTAGHTAHEVPGVYFALKFAKDYGTTADEKAKAGKYVKASGTTDAEKLIPANPVVATEDIEEAVGGLTTADGIEFKTSTLKGKFEIDEITSKTTYKKADGTIITASKAVPVDITLPLVNSKGTVLKAHVYPKNTENKPQIDKNFGKKDNTTENKADNDLVHADGFEAAQAGAQEGAKYENYNKTKETAKAEIGKTIPYEVKTKIPANSKLATAKWDDKMTEGLTYNKDLVVKINGQKINPTQDELTQTDNGFELNLQGDNLALLNGKDKEVEVELQYSAKVNKDAIADIPESNNVMFHYGNNPGHGNTPIPTKPKQNGELEVEKTWADGVPKAGEWATFTLKNAKTGKEIGTVKFETTNDGTTTTYTAAAGYEAIGNEKPQGPNTKTDKNNVWTFKFTGLDKDLEYKVEEDNNMNETAKFTKGEDGQIKIENKKDHNPTPLNPTSPKVVVGGKKFVKTNDKEKDSKELERLAYAEFYVKNSKNEYLVAKTSTEQSQENTNLAAKKEALDNAVKAFNDLTAEQQKTDTEKRNAIDEAQKAYNDAFKAAAQNYKWETTSTNAVLLVSDKQGRFEISGLEYGSYKLEEKTAPAGYANISDQEFTVAKGSYKGTENELRYTEEIKAKEGQQLTEEETKKNEESLKQGYGQQVKNKKVTIPQTGGIGSLIFIVAGVAIMAFAFVAYKRSEAREA